MSEAYENFAKETYETVYNAARQNLSEAQTKPILMVSGEDHHDPLLETITNWWTDDEKEAPAHSAAYTHIAAIKAAEDLVGRGNVIISFEQDPKFMQDLLSNMNRGLIPDFALDPGPAQMALLYAYQNGFDIVGTDAGYKIVMERADGNAEEAVNDPQRYAMENAAISALAENARIVVHIGGAAHIMTLQGYLPDSDFSDPNNLPAPADNPFDGVYGRVLYFNSDDEFTRESGATAFYRDPQNAIQIDAPGQMDKSDHREVGQRIDGASADMRSPTPSGDNDFTLSR